MMKPKFFAFVALFCVIGVACEAVSVDHFSGKNAPRVISDVLKVVRDAESSDSDDDIRCTGCVLGLLLLDDNVLENEQAIDNFLLSLCAILKRGEERDRCELIVNEYGVAVIQQLIDEHGPNKVCEKLGACTTCKLALPNEKLPERDSIEGNVRFLGLLMDIAHLEVPNNVPRRLRNYVGNELESTDPNPSETPALDIDNDLFAPGPRTRRGSKWRGKDCNDLTKNIRPGVHDDATGLVDNNCNGVKGKDSNTKKTYEEELCANDSPSRKSIVTFGDSAAAAFAIPVEWLSLQNLSGIIPAALQELDWPQQSWSTGYVDHLNSSVYQHWAKWNRCNHRDYQNLGRNGAKMKDLAPQARNMNPSTFPTLGFVAYIGNDVCRRTLSAMTKPEDYREQLLDGLTELDSLLLPGSKLLISGLVDGRVLWNTMANRIHPLGCTYAALYEFLTCTDSNPCNTWLNPDGLERNLTSQRAAELSQVAEDVVKTTQGKWKNIALGYQDFPAEEIFGIIKAMGGDPAVMIEQVDGFHPSPLAQELTGNVVWNQLRTEYPEWLGSPNPNNAKILELFGDQGGY